LASFFFRVTYFSNILLVICVFLILHGIYDLSTFYKRPNIFANARNGAIFVMIGFLFLSVGDFVSPIKTTSLFAWWPFLVIFAVFCIIATHFLKRSLNELAACSDNKRFIYVGKLLFGGAAFTVVFIGVPIMVTGMVRLTIAFFTTHETQASLSTAQSPLTMPAPAVEAIFCPNCGTPLLSAASFRAHCGK
jgi:uncharacterized membrane protein